MPAPVPWFVRNGSALSMVLLRYGRNNRLGSPQFISLAGGPFRGVDPVRYLAKAEAVLVHFCDRPLAGKALSPDKRPIVRSWPFIRPGSKPNGLCAFRQPIGFHSIDVIDWRSHSLLLTCVESLGLSRGQNGTRERQKLVRYRASQCAG
jgi:hypothetical protein